MEKAMGSRSKKIESLNDHSRAPQTKRKRLWPLEVIGERKRLRGIYPNLGGEFVDYNISLLRDPDAFNRKLMDYLIFYNTLRVHTAFRNKLSPVQFMLQWSEANTLKIPTESRIGLHYTPVRIGLLDVI